MSPGCSRSGTPRRRRPTRLRDGQFFSPGDPGFHRREAGVLDMSGVSYVDSAGVGALVQLFVHRRSQSKKLAVAALTTQGSAVLQVAGLTKLLPTFPTVEEAAALSLSYAPKLFIAQ